MGESRTDLARRLPGARTAPSAVAPDLVERFAKDPLEAWRRSTPAEQPVLQRLLWGRVQTARILLDAEADGRNGKDIAEQLKRLVPEEMRLAEQFELKFLAYRVERAAGLTRPELVSLTEDLKGRQRAEEARKAILV